MQNPGKPIAMNRLFVLLLCLPILSCVPVSQQGTTATGGSNGSGTNAYYVDKSMRTEDFTYEPNIQTVLLYPRPEGADPVSAVLQPPVLPLSQPVPLILEFDELRSDVKNYRAKLFHCDADWSISNLNDIDILDTYNEFLLNRPLLSVNTKMPYVHYFFELPKVKISGNYLIMVYREGNVKDIILTHRFIIYENQVEVAARVVPSSGVQERLTNQQVEFDIRYPNTALYNPRETLKITLRQNYQWSNAIINLKPTAIWEDRRLLEYHHFGLENSFQAGNEFRFFDIRSIRFLGQNVGKMDITGDSNKVFLLPDDIRNGRAYTQTIDFNGRYLIDNYEVNNGPTAADYVYVNFTLRAPAKANGNVYIWGQLTNWRTGDDSAMQYDAAEQVYRGRLLLKQGYYNYQYVLEENGRLNPVPFEGSHFNTENHYEVIAYHRPPGARGDLIIGYALVRHNQRN